MVPNTYRDLDDAVCPHSDDERRTDDHMGGKTR